jgi:hypothetical protein
MQTTGPRTEDTIRVLIGMLPAGNKARLIQELAAESTPAQIEDRIIRRAEASRLLARSPRAIDYLSAAGHLPKVTLPGHSRAAGYRLSCVQALISGKVVAQ